MRKNITFVFIALLSAIAFNVEAQIVINGDFENWTHIANYETPDSLNTLNATLASAFATPNVLKTSDAFHGNWAAKLVTVNVALLNRNVPGIITNGTYNTSYFTTSPPTGSPVVGGKRINYRPNYFNGWLKDTTKGHDTATMHIIFTKWNKSLGKRDTLGSASWMDTTTHSSYQHFSLPINYTISGVPDTFQFYALSAGVYGTHLGSVLYLDSLNFGPPPPSVQWNSTAMISDSENIGNILLPLHLSVVYNDTVKIYITTSGTTTTGVDYTILSANPMILAPGKLNDTVKIHIIDDAIPEPTETLNVHIGHTYNCSIAAFDSIAISIIDNDASGIVSLDANQSGLNIYPNPAKANLTISQPYNEYFKNIIITNVIGEIVLQPQTSSSTHLVININNLPSGIYFIKTTDVNGKVSNAKFVKE